MLAITGVVGLEGIVIADRDGVPIVKASMETIPDTALMSSFLSTFGLTSHQGGKLGMGENNTIICIYSTYQVVQMDLLGMIVTFIGNKNCNTGHILSIQKELNPIINDLTKVLTTDF
ncbi:ragulator complex protein LAMTOR3-A isoform X2 [Cimex lectularius]|uniref:Uncharacterized protein n=1 Tax=Cimex lectularius TaxID=79782 RepID=A0A8I6RAA5_CIMLE|nr:ragulator complex protein LAMTOR3-A isoform X2 [Cimex lectularius]